MGTVSTTLSTSGYIMSVGTAKPTKKHVAVAVSITTKEKVVAAIMVCACFKNLSKGGTRVCACVAEEGGGLVEKGREGYWRSI